MGALDELTRTIINDQGAGILVSALLIVLVLIVAPRGQRWRARIPAILWALHVGTLLIRGVVGAEGPDARPYELVALFFLGMSVARSGFLIGLFILGRRASWSLPKIFQDVIQGLIFGAVVFIVLQAAGVEPSSLLTTSALLTAVVGLSLQETLGNMFAGLAIQAQRPFEQGDWIQFTTAGQEQLVGRVTEMNWRAIRVRTLDDFEVIVPNGLLAKQPIINFNRPQVETRRDVFVFAPVDVAPGKVHRLLLDAARGVSGVLPNPEPTVVTQDFTERGVKYWLRYHIIDFGDREPIGSEVRNRVWYALQRAGVAIPPPIRHVELHEISEESRARDLKRKALGRERALSGVDFLSALPESARRHLAELSEMRHYGTGEVIVRENEEGDEFFIVDWGEVSVLKTAKQGEREVATLGAGSFFGEMSAITGEPRTATVKAVRDTELQVLRKAAFQEVLRATPELAEIISQTIAERRHSPAVESDSEAETSNVEERRSLLLGRIRKLFSL